MRSAGQGPRVTDQDQAYRQSGFGFGSSRHEGDRIAARRSIQCMELEHQLAREISYARGPNRDYVLDEMKIGIKVVFCPDFMVLSLEEVLPNEVGEVEGWHCSESAELDTIRVLWADGSSGDYPANSGDLARWDELI